MEKQGRIGLTPALRATRGSKGYRERRNREQTDMVN